MRLPDWGVSVLGLGVQAHRISKFHGTWDLPVIWRCSACWRRLLMSEPEPKPKPEPESIVFWKPCCEILCENRQSVWVTWTKESHLCCSVKQRENGHEEHTWKQTWNEGAWTILQVCCYCQIVFTVSQSEFNEFTTDVFNVRYVVCLLKCYLLYSKYSQLIVC